ncbi:MAG: hypothetical protein HY321_04520 [Armatimonadetes bacterium]|nr:hypothetical protein [Armatimonadota bacterium]
MPEMLVQMRDRLTHLCASRGIALSEPVVVRPLSADEAIGREADPDFAIRRGKEQVIEGTLLGYRGQAFTDRPGRFEGSLGAILALDLEDVARRAVFIAAANALLRALGIAGGTVHCTDEAPSLCGRQIAEKIEERFGRVRIGLIGLQPAILAGLVGRFGATNVRLLDLNPDNIGRVFSGVVAEDGVLKLKAVVEWCRVGLATGSSLVNGTLDEIHSAFAAAGKPVIFFGNTIAGAAALLGLERICPLAQ